MRFIYATNPLYLLSALFAIVGLRELFPPSEDASYAWILIASICGYITLLAVTGVVLSRLGGVWDDARSILCLIVLLFVVLSLCFDDLLLAEGGFGSAQLAAGGAFAVLASEFILRSLKLNFSALYRIPYYSSLALLFGAPMLLARLAHRSALTHGSLDVEVGLLLFPVAAAFILLTLLPAIRRGRIRPNDEAPWRWPWYPWSCIVLLSLGVSARVFALGLSFGASHVTGVYLLAPIVLAWSILLIEIGAKSNPPFGIRVARIIGPVLPLVILVAEIFDLKNDVMHQGMLSELTHSGASPVFCTAIGAVVVAAWARWRHGPSAEWTLVLAALTFVFVGPHSFGLADLEPTPWVLTLCGGLILARAWFFRSSPRYVLGFVVLMSGLSLEFVDEGFFRYTGVLPSHLTLLFALGIGWRCRDTFAFFLFRCGAAGLVLIPCVEIIVELKHPALALPQWAIVCDGILLSTLALILAQLAQSRSFLRAGYASSGITLGYLIALGWRHAADLSNGALALIGGLALFVAGLMLSAHKAGWWSTERLRKFRIVTFPNDEEMSTLSDDEILTYPSDDEDDRST